MTLKRYAKKMTIMTYMSYLQFGNIFDNKNI